MTAYTVRLSRRAAKDIRKLDKQIRARVIEALDRLARDPANAAGVKALQGRDGYRVRVGDYRIIYELDEGVLVVLVLRVGNRRDVYR